MPKRIIGKEPQRRLAPSLPQGASRLPGSRWIGGDRSADDLGAKHQGRDDTMPVPGHRIPRIARAGKQGSRVHGPHAGPENADLLNRFSRNRTRSTSPMSVFPYMRYVTAATSCRRFRSAK